MKGTDTLNQRLGEGSMVYKQLLDIVTYILLKLCFLAEPKREEMKVCIGSDRNENKRLEKLHFRFLKKLIQGGRKVK